jgi:prolyl 4-hydroxylase
VTFFLYLNDLDDDDDDGGAGAGGETRFTNIFGDETNIYLDVKPKKGRALIWPSMLNEDLNGFEHKTYHEARVVNKGNKYGANAWLHLRDYRNLECDEDELESVKSKLDQIQQQ